MNLFENLQKIKETDNIKHDELIKTMKEFEDNECTSSVGIFWYDWINKELFGVNKIDVDLIQANSNNGMKTYPKLHKQLWRNILRHSNNEEMKKYETNYTLVPRGRVFQMKDDSFEVMVGNWIDSYPESKELIINEFNLPIDNTKFVKDSHWNIGSGWSEEHI